VSSPLTLTFPSAAISALAALACVIPLSDARAQETTNPPAASASTGKTFTGYLVGGAISLPEYEGSSDMSVVPLITGQVRWGNNRYAASDGISGRINILDSENFEFGPAVNINLGRADDIESLRVRRLGEIDTAFEVGAFGAYTIKGVLGDRDAIRLSAQITGDVSDVHEGLVGDLTASYNAQLSERLGITASTSVSFANDEFADTYFSITRAGAFASGLTETTVEAGVKDFGLSVLATYGLSERWSLFGIARYSRLLGDFADSPIVAVEGDDNQFSLGLGIGWRF
jgi:MipA family protein